MTNSIHICPDLKLTIAGPAQAPLTRPSWLKRLGWILHDFRQRQEHRRAMAQLLRYGDDAVFKDIGINRTTVVEEYYHPTRYRHD